uniref:Paired domain-containing protein n=1 Tax=Plectus sambesii TaxID=2011161 RepID=A0A914VM27_9BILA
SHGCVSKILYRYAETGSISPGQIGGNPRSRMTIQAVEKQIVRLKTENPTMFANELREKLIEQDFCTRANAPTVSSINRLLRSRGLNSARDERDNDREKSPSPDTAKSTALKHSIDNLLGLVHQKQQQLVIVHIGSYPPSKAHPATYICDYDLIC